MDITGIILRLVPDAAMFNPACLGMDEDKARSGNFWTDERPIPTMEMAIEEQSVMDLEAEQRKYQENRKQAYPDPMVLNDAKVKQHSTDDTIKAEGVAQEEKYYQDCLDVKEANPKPEQT